MMSSLAFDKALTLEGVSLIADIGCGRGAHSRAFCNKGMSVHGFDIVDPKIDHPNFTYHRGVYPQSHIGVIPQFDCVWLSHVLEHILDIHSFLTSVYTMLQPGGYVVVTVPPLKHHIVGGHVSLWNAGLVMYRLALAGFDCKNAMVKKYGYNISVIARKGSMPNLADFSFDSGDIERLSNVLPNGYNKQSFNGDIQELNW